MRVTASPRHRSVSQAALEQVLDGGEYPSIRTVVRQYTIAMSIRHEMQRILRNFRCVRARMDVFFARGVCGRGLLGRFIKEIEPDFIVRSFDDIDVRGGCSAHRCCARKLCGGWGGTAAAADELL